MNYDLFFTISYLNSSYFWPGSFAIGGEMDVILREVSSPPNPSYGDEYIIDCRLLEIGRAVSTKSDVAPHIISGNEFRDITDNPLFRESSSQHLCQVSACILSFDLCVITYASMYPTYVWQIHIGNNRYKCNERLGKN